MLIPRYHKGGVVRAGIGARNGRMASRPQGKGLDVLLKATFEPFVQIPLKFTG